MTSWALVTGASSGIGRAVALRLARDGYAIALHYNSNKEGANETLKKVRELNVAAELLCFNVSEASSVESSLDSFFQQTHQDTLAVLVNNAGIHNDCLMGIMSDTAFDSVMKTNAYGAFYVMRSCVKRMLRQRSGCIVNIASLSGQTGNAGQVNYAASKAALIAMTKSLSQEVGSRGIRVNAVAPGLIETEMLNSIPHLDELKKRIPLQRLGSSDDVAGAVSFLCSRDSAYITGHTLSVNGGLFPT